MSCVSSRRPCILGALLLVMTGSGALAQGSAPARPVALIPHRAVYDLTLEHKKDDASIDSVRGRIVYDFSGNACEGYALRFRQVTEIGAAGGTNVSDLRSATFEDDAGTAFRFNSQSYMNQQLDSQVDGSAKRSDDHVAVALKKPGEGKFDLPGDALFPTGQIKAILAAAQAGRTTLESKIYDASETGRKVYNTLAVIGRKLDAAHPREAAVQARHELDAVEAWPVSVSYFDPESSKQGEQTPVYSIAFDLYADGISSTIRLDYGDFSLKGALASLDLLPQTACH